MSFQNAAVEDVNTLSPLELEIKHSKNQNKLPFIIGFLESNHRFKAKKSIDYGKLALEIIAKYPDIDKESIIYAYMARSAIFIQKMKQAEEWANKALLLAQNSQNIENEIFAYIALSLLSRRTSDYQQALLLNNKAMSLAQTVNDQLLIANIHASNGMIFKEKLEYSQSLLSLSLALEIYIHLNDQVSIARMHGQLALVYGTISLFDKALENLLVALKIFQGLNNPKNLSIVYGNIGVNYKYIGDYEHSIEMHLKSIELKKSLGYKRGLLNSYNNLGESYRLSGNVNQAKRSLFQALSLEKEQNLPGIRANTFLYLGRLYRDEHEFELSNDYLTQCLAIYKSRNDPKRIGETLLALGRLNVIQNNTDAAIENFKTSINYLTKTKKHSLLLEVYQELSDAYQNNKRYSEALEIKNRYLLLKESIFNDNKKYRIEELKIKFKVEEQKQQIEILTKTNKIKALEFESNELKTKIIVVVLLFFFSVIAFVYLRFSKNKELAQKQKALMEITHGKNRLFLALWGSGDSLWDWDLTTSTLTRENHQSNIFLPSQNNTYSLNELKNYVHPDDFPTLVDNFTQHINNQSEYFECSYRVRTINDGWLWVLDKGKVTERDQTGKALHITGTLKDISNIKAFELELKILNKELEQRVLQRTKELQKSNDELSLTLYELTQTQENLVAAEKMASLGRLVSGVAHELNTPLGTAVTAISTLKDEIKAFDLLYLSNKVSRSALKKFIDVSINSTALIDTNINRAVVLVQEFKKVSSIEFTIYSQKFNIKDQLLTVLVKSIQEDNYPITINCPDNILITSDVDCLSNILNALYINSVIHGFENIEYGKVIIDVIQAEDHIKIKYYDDGVGIKQQEIENIFEPFYTTKRYEGHTGLGLHIVFNLISQSLQGTIEYNADGAQGASFDITLPLAIST